MSERNCHICSKDNEPIVKECCGVKVCFPCESRFAGLCSVCQRDELNCEIICDCCGKEGNMMTISYCPYCEDMLCDDCLSIKEHPVILCKKERCMVEFMDDDEESEQDQVVPNIYPENRIPFVMSFILNKASQINNIFYNSFEYPTNNTSLNGGVSLTYSEIKNELVPALQAEGFDVKLFYTEDNQFDEQHFDNIVDIEWNEHNVPPSTYMRHKIEQFPKTTDEYHQFEN